MSLPRFNGAPAGQAEAEMLGCCASSRFAARMTGVDLLSIVRAYDLDVPFVLMTGTPTVETAMEAVSLGALQYLPKPMTNEVLVKTVERASPG